MDGFEQRLRAPTSDFLLAWPARTFSRDQKFREDLARASDVAGCVARQMLAVEPPDIRFAAFDEALDIALEGYIVDMAKGREAAQQRNVSKYREWLRAVDGLPGTLEAARLNLPPR